MSTGCGKRITVMHLIGALRIGGAERQLVALAPQFDPERFRIIIATMQPVGVLDGMLQGTHVEHIEIHYRTRYFPAAIWRLRTMLKREKVDVLHTHMYGASHYGRIAGALAGVPVMVTTDHGHDPWKKWRHIAFEKYMLRHTAMRIAVSEDVAKILRSREGVPDEKLIVLPNGVDVERFQVDSTACGKARDELGFSDDIMVVGAIGRLVEPKALHVLGDGDAIQEAKEFKREHSLDNVQFDGFQTGDALRKIVEGASFMVIPSEWYENCPMTILEAFASGKPVIGSRYGGIPEMIDDGVNGLLFEPGDAGGLASLMRTLAENPGLAEEMGRKGRSKVEERYSIRAYMNSLLDIYRRVLARS